MDIFKKLEILSDAAKYDVSCSSSGSNRKNAKGGIGNCSSNGICHTFTPDGRCVSLLKILLTNYCIYDCKYCINKISNDVPRAFFTPEEVVDLTINFYKRNYIEGLFLSSAIIQNVDYTMELLLKVIKTLRLQYKFNGYIHVKAIPGADNKLIEEAGMYADRMSVNIELPSSNGLKLLAPQKNKDSILKPMSFIKNGIIHSKENKKLFKSAPNFVPGGQSTQLIVGATNDNDLSILKLCESLYKGYDLKRVYYSAYVPVNHGGNLPNIDTPPILRENRLYQADWLMRFYGFKSNEILNEDNPNFHEKLDPKTFYALNNLTLFPVEINTAPYELLLRVPGIGLKSAKRIVLTRKVSFLSFEDLKKLGIVLKRAKYFITCKGKYYGEIDMEREKIEKKLILEKDNNKNINLNFEQLSLFESPTPSKEDKIKVITGQI